MDMDAAALGKLYDEGIKAMTGHHSLRLGAAALGDLDPDLGVLAVELDCESFAAPANVLQKRGVQATLLQQYLAAPELGTVVFLAVASRPVAEVCAQQKASLRFLRRCGISCLGECVEAHILLLEPRGEGAYLRMDTVEDALEQAIRQRVVLGPSLRVGAIEVGVARFDGRRCQHRDVVFVTSSLSRARRRRAFRREA